MRRLLSIFVISTVCVSSSVFAVVPTTPVIPAGTEATVKAVVEDSKQESPPPVTSENGADVKLAPASSSSPPSSPNTPVTTAPAVAPATPANDAFIGGSTRFVKPGEESGPITAELSDGTLAVFNNDGHVSILTPEGKHLNPPDGILTLKDGTTFSVKDGMRIEE